MKRDRKNTSWSNFKRSAIVLLFLTAAVVSLLHGRYIIAFNSSDSLDGQVFLIKLGTAETMRLGAIAAFAFDGSAWGFPSGIPWAKRVVGLPGEAISVNGSQVMVGGRLVAMLDSQVMDKDNLTPTNSQVVPPEHLFVIGDHQRSFDSRYQEFGLISITEVLGEAIKIW